MKAASILDYRELARRRLPPFLFEYIDGGSYAEVTLRRNTDDLRSIALRQRVMMNVDGIDLTTSLFGTPQTMPIALGPVGLSGMYARRGEVQAARAANAAGVPFALSTVGVCPLAEIAAGTGKPFWFQLYVVKDRDFVQHMIAEAKAAGCTVMLLTVDLPVSGTRYRDVHSGLSGSAGWTGALRRFGQGAMHPRWAWDVGLLGRPHTLGNVAPMLKGDTGLEDFLAWMSTNFDKTVTWDSLAWLRSQWDGPIVVKGVLDPEDARLAAQYGADGIVVSNHGGRQLDGVPSTAAALPPIVDAVGDKLTVLVDGGVRSGLDAVRMLALGAKGVLLGRAWAYALGAAGQAGVAHMLSLIEAEMRVAMALTGVTRIDQITRDILVQDKG
jgi:L-lactate dehydrogenase (cytochrome)